MPIIHVEPLGKALTAERGTPLRDLLQGARILLDFPCGGKGTCRQCRVTIDPPPASGEGKLAEAESAGGVRLACQTVIEGDCTVTIPEARMSGKVWKQGLRDSDIGTEVGGTLQRIEVPLAAPSLDDQRSDWERLTAGLESRGIRAATPDARSLEQLSGLLRESGWTAEALCEENDFLWLGARRGGHAHGFAVDLGTTTVDIALFDLDTGRRLGRRAFLNGQVAFGADVISRAFHSEREPVRRAALETIDEGARTLLAEAGVKPELVVKTVVVGNPIMLHILNGIDPWQLTSVPYIPAASCSLRSAPRELGWTFQKGGYVETLPLISAYVGADTIGMIVALDLEREAKSSLNIAPIATAVTHSTSIVDGAICSSLKLFQSNVMQRN
ncbi:MAG: 2Fe-2S iron-sulfur cluster-binding protein, partial [Spirochaetes bacterium]|nr:2Fe-2S iron-sulfur cluster-binding protein [Spirochaetota bacterium]